MRHRIDLERTRGLVRDLFFCEARSDLFGVLLAAFKSACCECKQCPRERKAARSLVEIERVTSAMRDPRVSAILTLYTVERPGHDLEPPRLDRLLAIEAVAKLVGILLEARERVVDLLEHQRALFITSGGDDLVHFVERLRVLVRPLGRVDLVRIDLDIALSHEVIALLEQQHAQPLDVDFIITGIVHRLYSSSADAAALASVTSCRKPG